MFPKLGKYCCLVAAVADVFNLFLFYFCMCVYSEANTCVRINVYYKYWAAKPEASFACFSLPLLLCYCCYCCCRITRYTQPCVEYLYKLLKFIFYTNTTTYAHTNKYIYRCVCVCSTHCVWKLRYFALSLFEYE